MGAYNPGAINDRLSGGDAGNSAAGPQYTEFFNNVFNDRSSIIRPDAHILAQYASFLPELTIGGNSPEDLIEEHETTDGCTIVRDNRGFHYTAECQDGTSSFSQTGTGRDAYRRWRDDSGRSITRHGDRIQIGFGPNSTNGGIDEQYVIDAGSGTVTRQYDHWRVVQQTVDEAGTASSTISENSLSLSVTGEGTDRQTDLSFMDSSRGLTYHATSEGVEIVAEGGTPRFLLSQNKLYSLTSAEPGNGNLFVGNDGQLYTMDEISTVGNLRARLGINQGGEIVIDGLMVSVDNAGNIMAQSTASDNLSIEVTADGTQIVRSADGYSTSIGPDGRLQVFGPNGECLAFFDPYTGIVGNETVQFGADFSSLGGLVLDLMFQEVIASAHARAVQERVEANTLAQTTLQKAAVDAGSVQGRILSGTVRPDCFGVLTSCIGDLNSALGACLASGARENIGAIISALGLVQIQLSQAHFKYNTMLTAQNAGITGSQSLAIIQQNTQPTSDPIAVVQPWIPTAV